MRDNLNPTIQTIETMRSVRDFKPDRVEDGKLLSILEAAIRAPSSGNSQPWAFIVVREKEKKRLVGRVISERWHELMDSRIAKMPSDTRRIYEGATTLVDSTADIPVIVLACIDMEKASRSEEARYASIYPAVQNMMLAAWSLGLGSCITTHASSPSRGEEDVKRILGIPRDVKIACLVYLGYPARPLGPPVRPGVGKFVHYEAW